MIPAPAKKKSATFKNKVSTSGNSSMVRIPQKEIDDLNLSKGDDVLVTIEPAPDASFENTKDAALAFASRFPLTMKRLGE